MKIKKMRKIAQKSLWDNYSDYYGPVEFGVLNDAVEHAFDEVARTHKEAKRVKKMGCGALNDSIASNYESLTGFDDEATAIRKKKYTTAGDAGIVPKTDSGDCSLEQVDGMWRFKGPDVRMEQVSSGENVIGKLANVPDKWSYTFKLNSEIDDKKLDEVFGSTSTPEFRHQQYKLRLEEYNYEIIDRFSFCVATFTQGTDTWRLVIEKGSDIDKHFLKCASESIDWLNEYQ